MGNGNGWATKILIGLVTMLVAWTAYEAIETHSFRNAGGRFTESDGLALAHRIDALEMRAGFWREELLNALSSLTIETKRLQLQIDRLEGHDIDTYTKDKDKDWGGNVQ